MAKRITLAQKRRGWSYRTMAERNRDRLTAVAPLQLIGTKYAPGAGGEGDGLSSDATHLAASSRHRHDMPAYDVILEEVHYANWYYPPTTAGETAGPNAFSVKAAWDSEAGVYTPLYPLANANRPESVAGGSTLIVKPSMPIEIPGGSKPFSRQRVSVVLNSPANRWLTNRAVKSERGESDNQFGTGAGTDQVDATGTFPGTVPTYSFGPAALIGRPKDGKPRPAIIICDDSTGTVSGVDASPNFGNADGYAGKWERKIGSSIATLNVARATSQLRGFAASHTRLMGYVRYCSDFILPSFFNDWSTGRTSTEILADFATMIAAVKAAADAADKTVRIWACTSWPKPTATANSWQDGGSTKNATTDGHRLTVNTAIRAGLSGVYGYFDFALQLEDPGRAGFYKASNPAYSTDGSHLTDGGNALAGNAIDLSRFAL